jgi:hypothetical protein
MKSDVQVVKSRRDRPGGISLIAILLMLQVINIFFGIKFLASGNQSISSDVTNIIGIFIAVLALPLAWGLWTLKLWAVRETIGLEIIVILCRIGEFLVFQQWHSGYYILVSIASVLINAWIIYYLATNQKVREAFRRL